ncbi:MAG: hypothetical protein GF416_05435 [Candidatus Altiarchaeales archaeon]|nr:hypothetical protein [Candidatus Altiarchaeales archaeon]MBD3416560.1 hypothetical protein [Candidatus Altiarchaeales archaeon]
MKKKTKRKPKGVELQMGKRTLNLTLELAVNIIAFIVIYGFLVSVFTPDVMLAKTITAGGDTASHYYPAKFLKEELIPKGHVIGWLPGWYGGMPLFQFYFTLPFVMIALLGYIIPLQISFKLVTVLGIFSLPLTVFASLKLMRFKFPTPVFGAIFTLPFLFQESHSMWGGNIPSTLAGEFSYSISLSLTMLFFGVLYYGIQRNKHMLANAFILALVALTHVYTVLWAVLSSLILSYDRNPKRLLERVKYMGKSFPLAFMLTGFWIIPLILRLKYTTSYDIPWNITEEVLPPILWPFLFFSGFGLFMCAYRRDSRVVFLTYSIVTSLVFFVLAPKIGVVDIRFLPFTYLTLMVLAAYGLSQFIRPLKGKWILPLIVVLLTVFWVNSNKVLITSQDDKIEFHPGKFMEQMKTWKYGGYTPYWVEWNYEGFEKKSIWKQFKSTNDFMGGDVSSPRAKFEHNDKHNAAGTVRAFESIPLFAGRSILEGLYMQSIITSPFTFYIQSEVSEQQSCPFWAVYPCTSFNLEDGTEHLKMFNTQYLVARSEKLKEALVLHPEWRMAFRDEPFEVWELTTNPNQYVTVPEYMPVLYETGDWKNISYQWFRNMDLIDSPIAFKKSADTDDMRLFQDVIRDPSMADLDSLPKTPLNRECNVREIVQSDVIEFTTDCVGAPHIISISYYPSWKPEGADEIYLVSPSFMLVYPTQKHVRIVYGKTPVDWIGILLTLSAVSVIAYAHLGKNRELKRFFAL